MSFRLNQKVTEVLGSLDLVLRNKKIAANGRVRNEVAWTTSCEIVPFTGSIWDQIIDVNTGDEAETIMRKQQFSKGRLMTDDVLCLVNSMLTCRR